MQFLEFSTFKFKDSGYEYTKHLYFSIQQYLCWLQHVNPRLVESSIKMSLTHYTLTIFT